MIDTIFSSIDASSNLGFSVQNLLLTLGTALLLGLLVSMIYIKTHKNKYPSQSFAISLVVLPTVVSIIIMLAGTNIASALSLAGAFSIIRFRSAPGDPKDITFVLFSMAIGLSTGMGFLIYAFIVSFILCFAMIALELSNFGKLKTSAKLLKITIPENLNYEDAFDKVMKEFTLSYNLNKVKTTDLGSLYELEYSVITRKDQKEKDFIDELRIRNGNLNITMVLNSNNTDF